MLIGVTQASVSRWERGVSPSLDDMRKIRVAASDRGIEWDDGWFFLSLEKSPSEAAE